MLTSAILPESRPFCPRRILRRYGPKTWLANAGLDGNAPSPALTGGRLAVPVSRGPVAQNFFVTLIL